MLLVVVVMERGLLLTVVIERGLLLVVVMEDDQWSESRSRSRSLRLLWLLLLLRWRCSLPLSGVIATATAAAAAAGVEYTGGRFLGPIAGGLCPLESGDSFLVGYLDHIVVTFGVAELPDLFPSCVGCRFQLVLQLVDLLLQLVALGLERAQEGALLRLVLLGQVLETVGASHLRVCHLQGHCRLLHLIDVHVVVVVVVHLGSLVVLGLLVLDCWLELFFFLFG